MLIQHAIALHPREMVAGVIELHAAGTADERKRIGRIETFIEIVNWMDEA